MQVAVVSVRMVQRTSHLVVDVVPVRHRMVPAIASVLSLALDWGAAPGSSPVDVEAMLVGV